MKKLWSITCLLLVFATITNFLTASAAGAEKWEKAIDAIPAFRVVASTSVYANSNLTGWLYDVAKGTGLSGNTANWSYSSGSIYVSRNGVSGYIAKKKIAPTASLKTVITADYLYTGANGAEYAYANPVPVGTYGYYMGQSTIGATTWFYLRVFIGSSVYTGWMKASKVASAS